MVKPKTIQIFLPDGNPRGIKIAEITSRTVQAILSPRASLGLAGKRTELSNVGIYYLIGQGDEDTKSVVYIGEAENCKKRLSQHNRSKDFWSTSISIISKTQQFTKSHIKYLEWLSIAEANKSGRFLVENGTTPQKPYITESTEADLIDNFDTIRILVSTLGYPLFEQVDKRDEEYLFYCKGRGAIGVGKYLEDGFLVFKDSTTAIEEVKSADVALVNSRKKLLDNGILKKEGNYYIFTQDYLFKSPSWSGATILGRHTNGWTSWKLKNGKTLDEIYRKGR